MAENSFLPYLDQPRAFLVTNLARVSGVLCDLYHELAAVQSQEVEARSSAWRENEATSATAREQWAKVAAADFTASIYEIKGQIAAYVEERDLLRILLAHE